MSENRDKFTIMYFTLSLTIFLSLSFNMGGMFAGKIAVLLKAFQVESPWVFLLYPLLLTVRGNISGILTGKLGTALHLGTIKPIWFKNTSRFKQLRGIVFSLTVCNAILVGFIAYIYGLIFNISVNFIAILVVALVSFAITFIISDILTVSFAFFLFRKEKDPDKVLYPVMSTTNDIIITFIFFVVYLVFDPVNTYRIYYIGLPLVLIIVGIVIYFFIKWIRLEYFKESLSQSLPVITLTTFIAAGTGTILSYFEDVILSYVFLLVVYPACITLVGSQGSIIVNTFTTKLHLGTIKADFSFFKNKEMQVFFTSLVTVGLIMKLIFTTLAFPIAPMELKIGLFFKLLAVLVLANIISIVIISFLSITVAIISYKIGLDPDNIVIPVLTSSADLIVTIFLVVFALSIF